MSNLPVDYNYKLNLKTCNLYMNSKSIRGNITKLIDGYRIYITGGVYIFTQDLQIAKELKAYYLWEQV